MTRFEFTITNASGKFCFKIVTIYCLWFWLSSYREEDFQKSTNQKQELPVAAMFVNFKDASYQVSVHLAKLFQRKIIKKISHSETSRLWQPCLLADREEMSNLYRGPSINASYQIPVHLTKRFQRRRFFRNQPIRNKNCLWWPCCFLPNFDSFG